MSVSLQQHNLDKWLNKNVSHETITELQQYQNEIKKWNNHLNLVSQNDLQNLWYRHILDSAQLQKFITENTIIDIGSGGGFPAIVLAILNKKTANFQIFLIEKLKKKSVFLQNMIAKFNLPATVFAQKIQDFALPNESKQKLEQLAKKQIAITSRAFATINDIFNFSYHISSKYNCYYYLPKGKSYNQELEQAAQNWLFEYELKTSEIASDSVILIIKNLSKKCKN